MKRFGGFPAQDAVYRYPDMPSSAICCRRLRDMAELKTTLARYCTCFIARKGYPRLSAFSELLGNTGLMKSLAEENERPEDILQVSPAKAVAGARYYSISCRR